MCGFVEGLMVCVCVCVALCVEPVLEVEGEREEKKMTVGKPKKTKSEKKVTVRKK